MDASCVLRGSVVVGSHEARTTQAHYLKETTPFYRRPKKGDPKQNNPKQIQGDPKQNNPKQNNPKQP